LLKVRRCNAQFQQAEVTIRQLSFELDDLSSLSEHLQGMAEAADAAAAAARGELDRCTRVHRLEIEAIKQEAEKGVMQLRHTFNDTLQQTKAVMASEMDMLRAKLASKTRDFENALSSEEQHRSDLDAAAATIADVNRMLVEERAHARQKQQQLQVANARLTAQLEDNEAQIEEYEKVIQYTAKSLFRRHRADYSAFCRRFKHSLTWKSSRLQKRSAPPPMKSDVCALPPSKTSTSSKESCRERGR
jgi:chromosome segregation ATPase